MNNILRQTILFTFCLLTSDFFLQAQNLPSYMPANGLVGWWPFNGNANDESGNGNNASEIQAAPATDRFGNPGKAYDFNGANSRIICPVSNIPTGNSPSSISLWFKSRIFPFPADTSRAMLSWGSWTNNSARYIGLRGASNNQLTYAQYLNDVNVPFNYQLNEWYHIVANYANDTISIFVNGSKISTLSISGTNTSAGPVIIGSSPGLTDHFNGLIDDAAIYNRTLTQQEITALYQDGNASTSCPVLPANLQQGLKGYWPFCGNAIDESGNGNNGTVIGATLTADRFGNVSHAFAFNGNARIKTPSSSTSLDINQNLTIAFWVKHSNDAGEPPFLWRGDSQGEFDPYSFYRSGNEFIFRRDVGTGNQIETVVFPKNMAQSDTWIQLAGVFEASTNKMSIFLNGQLMASRVVSTPIQYSTSGFITQFGGVEDFPGYIGLLDDIAIWNRALQNITLDAGNLASMQGWKIKISNSLGQEVYPASLINQQQQVLDLSNWGGNGLYLLHLINPQGHITEVKKIILAP